MAAMRERLEIDGILAQAPALLKASAASIA